MTRALVDVVSGTSGTRRARQAVRATRFTKAARRRRSGCRPSSAIMTRAAFRCSCQARSQAPGRRALSPGHARLCDAADAQGRSDNLLRGRAGVRRTGGDQQSRQDMFPSKVASYNRERLLGNSSTTARSNFHPDHPLYRLIGDLARIRDHAPSAHARAAAHSYSSDKPGLFAVSRFDPTNGREMLLPFNSSTQSIHQHVRVRPVRRGS